MRLFKACTLLVLVVCALAQPADAATRSKSIRADFMRENACPSTGKHRGACPGYEVDHVEALCAGGDDSVGNMQWLSRSEHKAKTRLDVMHCRLRKHDAASNAENTKLQN